MKKPIEWKNTLDKPYYIEYAFPISVTNRCWPFWANTNKGWKKVLNLANALVGNNRMGTL